MSDLISRQALFEYALNQKDKSVTLNDIMRFPSAQPELTQNLHNACTALIGRQAAIELIERMKPYHQNADDIAEMIANMPSAQPEIIRCRNCKFASGDSRICMQFGHSPIGELDFCAWAERRTDE